LPVMGQYAFLLQYIHTQGRGLGKGSVSGDGMLADILPFLAGLSKIITGELRKKDEFMRVSGSFTFAANPTFFVHSSLVR